MMRWLWLACTYCIAGASLSWYDRPLTRLGTEPVTADNEALALTLVASASLGGKEGQRLFAEVTKAEANLAEVLQDAQNYRAYVLVIPGQVVPARRQLGQPFLSVVNGTHGSMMEQLLPIDAINSASALLEAVLGRHLHHFRLDTLPETSLHANAPWAVWEPSSSLLHLHPRIFESLQGYPLKLADSIAAFAMALIDHLPTDLGSWGPSTVTSIASLFTFAAAQAAAVVGGSVPLWYCIGCPVVLGMLSPFAFNLGLGEVANILCEHYSLPDEQCNDLWYGAFALAMVLSFASVLPIVTICKLKQCAQGTT